MASQAEEGTGARSAAVIVGRSIATGVPTLTRGARAGVFAGLLFAAFEVAAAASTQGDALAPLAMISSVALGPGAMSGMHSAGLVAAVGVVVHVLLSAVYGGLFGMLSTGNESRLGLLIFATAFGFALWIVNFYFIAPQLFPWFSGADPTVQFAAHTFFFGTALGAVLAARIRKG